MKSARGDTGFTLIELLVVIAIIGVLASIVTMAMGTSREKSRNANVLQQMDQYSKALELYFTDNGRYPNGATSPVNFPERVYCIGNGYTGTPSPCLPTSANPVTAASANLVPRVQSGNNAAHIEAQLVPRYISQLPSYFVSKGGQSYSSPAYSACNRAGTIPCGNFRDYSLWFVLEGVNQNCGRAEVVNTALPGNNFTLCRMGPSR